MLTDDLPWPELGNVSRGATRGNQGQKGVLGTPDADGRAVLQLRVQPGVLPVKLNKQSTEWYRVLDGEVNRALKLTKTYWRKARRRQDYDARADQDHMELHEWLQQLKDKVMSHLEMLMQKGEIQGPPYIMPDNVELSFLRKFIERQAAGIPHNPRLRHGHVPTSSPRTVQRYIDERLLEGSSTSPSMSWDADERDLSGASPTMGSFTDMQSVMTEVDNNRRQLRSARAALTRAQRDTQESFKRYKTCLDVEAQALQQVNSAEERRDALMASLMEVCRAEGSEASDTSSRKSYPVEDTSHHPMDPQNDPRPSPKQGHDQISSLYKPAEPAVNGGWRTQLQPWDQHPVNGGSGLGGVPQAAYQAYPTASHPQDISMDVSGMQTRKHTRDWEMTSGPSNMEDFTLPPGKRYHLEVGDLLGASRPTSALRRPSFPSAA